MTAFDKIQSNALAAFFALLLSAAFIGISVGPAETAAMSSLIA